MKKEIDLCSTSAKELIKFLSDLLEAEQKRYGPDADVYINMGENAGTAYDDYGGRCSPPEFIYYEPKLILRVDKWNDLQVHIEKDNEE